MPDSSMITGSFNGTDEAILNKLRGGLYERILEGVREQVDIEDIRLQSYIVTQKLSGQVLHHRSGTLIDSIRVIRAQIQGNTVTGGVEGAGGNAFYGRFFEEGGKGPYTIVPVNAKALAFLGRDGIMVFCKRVQHPPIPKLPFMQPSLDENRNGITERVRARVVTEYNRVVSK